MRRLLDIAITRAGDPGSLKYTERQLYYEFCRALVPPPGLSDTGAATLLGFSLIPAILSFRRPKRALAIGLTGAAAAAGLRAVRAAPFTLPVPVGYDTFLAVLASRIDELGRPAGLLANAREQLPNDGSAVDVEAHGLQRVIVCQSDAIAAMLRANWMHIEAGCAVVGGDEGLTQPMRAGLAKTPKSRAFVLHDASVEGIEFATGVRQRLDLPDNVRIRLLGLRPVHARRLHLFATKEGRREVELPAGLPDSDRRFLQAGDSCEVAAVPPARLLRTVRRLALGHPRTTARRAQRVRREQGFLTWPKE